MSMYGERKNYKAGSRLKQPTVGPSLTKQSFTEECDINKIVARAEQTGYLSHVSSVEPMFGDVSDIPDYREMLHIVMDAQEKFMSLPAELRKRFDNDPAQLMAFVSDDKNRDEAEKLGLVKPKPAEPAREPGSGPEVQEGPKAPKDGPKGKPGASKGVPRDAAEQESS